MMLVREEHLLQKSDESAWTIVRSEASTSICDSDYRMSMESTELIYRRLSFEDTLFTARVYKRNYRNLKIDQLFKNRRHSLHTPTVKHQADSDHDASSILEYYAESHIHSEHSTIIESSGNGQLGNSANPIIREHLNLKSSDVQNLHNACGEGNEILVEQLLEQGVNVHAPERGARYGYGYGSSPMHIAARLGSIGVIRILLRYGARINQTDSTMLQPLHVAAREGNVSLTTFLVQKRAPLNCVDTLGERPIHKACLIGSLGVVRILVEAGATVDTRHKNRSQPLHYASRYYDNSELITYLIENGGNINATNPMGHTALQLACKSGHLAAVRTLLSFGARPKCWSCLELYLLVPFTVRARSLPSSCVCYDGARD